MRHYVCYLLIRFATACVLAKSTDEPRVSEPVIFTGICGGSAGAAVGSDLFIVADDESNELRVYRRDQGGVPLQVFDLTTQLELDRHAPETDIEGAARLGDQVYWISSHSRNHLGKQHANRYRFFATRLQLTNGAVQLSFVGRPYKDLLSDLAVAPELRPFDLATASRRVPKAEGALNIEGLCATPENNLLIGFRNPIPNGRALLVPLLNPEEVLYGRRPKFGTPIQLDLNGLGIRDMAYADGRYLIIAGPSDGLGKSKLYSWAGGTSIPKHLKEIDLKGFNAEALIIYPDKGLESVQLLSDDSSHQDSNKSCKELSQSERHFRSVWVKPGLKHLHTR